MSDIAEPTTVDPTTPVERAASHRMNSAGWAIGLTIAAVVGWLAMHYFPPQYTLPAELTAGTVANSPELSAKASQLGAENNWKNALVTLALVGGAFGLFPPLFSGLGPRRAVPAAIVGLLVGIGCGVAAAAAALWIKEAWGPAEADAALEEEASMWTDVIVYVAMSTLVALPAGVVFLMNRVPQAAQKFVAVPLGGLAAGLLLPVLASFVVPDVKTDVIPPTDLVLSGLWLGLVAVLVFLLTVMTGDKRRTPAESAG